MAHAVNTSLCMHPLSQDELQTYSNISQQAASQGIQAEIFPTPTHCIGVADGKLKGFVYVCHDVHSGVSQLPLSREIFHGHSAVECNATSSDIVQLLQDPEQMVCKMQELICRICARQSLGPVATLDCRPDTPAAASGLAGRCGSSSSMDSGPWVPEMPSSIGLYHAFVRGHNRDTRMHKLFIVVSGGCCKASDEFYNTVLDCHGLASVKECATSEEAWWLRRACFRARSVHPFVYYPPRKVRERERTVPLLRTAMRKTHKHTHTRARRCRLLAECAAHFSLDIKTIKDVQSCSANQETMALASINTVTHDLVFHAPGKTCVYDGCIGVTEIKNGSLCSMHPSEGFWIFQGVHDRAHGATAAPYGVGWHAPLHVAMPTSVVKCSNALRTTNHATVTTSDATFITRINPITQKQAPPEKACSYQFLDHNALTFMSNQLGWPMDRGVVELIPIVTGFSSYD